MGNTRKNGSPLVKWITVGKISQKSGQDWKKWVTLKYFGQTGKRGQT